MTQDIRWQQRFANFQKALTQLSEAVTLSQSRSLTKLEAQGLIQSFEYTHELAWNTLKDFLTSKGTATLYGSRDTTKEAFAQNLIQNGEVWMKMIDSRNLTTHTYDEKTVADITTLILNSYYPELQTINSTLQNLL